MSQKKLNRFPWVAIFFLLLGGVIFFLRIPVLSNAFCDPDLGDPAYGARLYLDGKCPYSHSVITKPPGSLLIYAVVFTLFGSDMTFIHLLAGLWTLAACLLLFVIAGQNGGREEGFLAAGLYALYHADLVSAGLCANFETWTILPALGALALICRGSTNEPRGRWFGRNFFAGLVACLGFWMKQPAVLFIAAAALVILLQAVQPSATKGQRQKVAMGFGAYLAGLALTCALFFFLMGSTDCMASLLDIMNPVKMGGYLGTVDLGQRSAFFVESGVRFFRSNRFLMLFLVLGLAVVFLSMRLRVRGPAKLYSAGLLFTIASVAMVYSGGRFFGHYFVVVLPFFCLCIALAFKAIRIHANPTTRYLLTAFLLAGALLDQSPEIKFAGLAARSLAQSGSPFSREMFTANAEGKLEPGQTNQLISYLEWQPMLWQVGELLSSRLQPGDAIWTLDYFPDLYHYTRTFAPTRHHNNFEFVVQSETGYYGLWHNAVTRKVTENRKELIRDLHARPPRCILRYRSECPPFVTPQEKSSAMWPHNSYGDPVSVCFDRMPPFEQLREFIREHYVTVDIDQNYGFEILWYAPTGNPEEK